MLSDDENRELERLEEAIKRLDDVDPSEIDAKEYGRMLMRLVELREKS